MDRELLVRARAGDREAFEQIVLAKGEPLFRTAMAILGNEADARDATQETFVAAWKGLPFLKDFDRFDAWLGRILINESRMTMRRRRRANEVVLPDSDSEASSSDSPTPASPDFDAAFNRLSVDQRAMLVLHHLHGYGVDEIGAWLGMPTGTVKWRLSRARRALAAQLDQDLMDDDQVRDELERRSKSAEFRADELLPNVRPGIGVRPRPARVARWAPLAGLAAAAVIVVALVIAWPRSPSVSGPGVSASSASATEVECLLDGATWQIAISDETGLIESCSTIPVERLSSPTATRQGVLTTIELRLSGSPCDILSPLRFTYEAAGYYLRSSRPTDGSCPASLMEAAVRLNLRSPIDASSVSVLLGAAAATPLPTQQLDCGEQISVNDHSGLIQRCEDAGAVDRHSQDPNVSNPGGNLYRVHVWWGISESSTVTAIDVYRTSDDAYYISVVNVASPDSFFRPDAHAVDLVFDLPVPASSVTLRTYSGASESTTPSTSPSSSASASERALQCGSTMTLLDTTGLAESCDLQADVAFPPPWGGYQVGWTISSGQIVAQWLSPNCPSVLSSLFQGAGDGYELAISADSSPVPTASPSCAVGPLGMTLTLTLRAPVAGTVHVMVNGQDLAPLPAPSATPDAIGCGDTMTVIDTTGKVVACSDEGGRDYHSQDPHASVDSANPSRLDIWWGQSSCTVSYEIDVSPAPSNLPQPADFDVGVTTTISNKEASGCDPDAHAASIDFASPVDASRIRLAINDQRLADPVPCASAPGLLDAGDEVDIYDSTDFITSCTQRQPSSDPTERVSNLTDSSIVVRWTDRPCGVPIHLMFDSSGADFVLSKPGQCMVNTPMTYEIVISFTQSIPAASVDASGLTIRN